MSGDGEERSLVTKDAWPARGGCVHCRGGLGGIRGGGLMMYPPHPGASSNNGSIVRVPTGVVDLFSNPSS